MAQLAKGETLQCEEELIAISLAHLIVTQLNCGAYVVIPAQFSWGHHRFLNVRDAFKNWREPGSPIFEIP